MNYLHVRMISFPWCGNDSLEDLSPASASLCSKMVEKVDNAIYKVDHDFINMICAVCTYIST